MAGLAVPNLKVIRGGLNSFSEVGYEKNHASVVLGLGDGGGYGWAG